MQMKAGRTYLYIILSSLALITVLVIQVSWMFRTARVKEELFNEKANMVLVKTAEALAADKQTCRTMQICGVGNNEILKIDSLFRHYMKFYNLHIDYSFEVLNPVSPVSLKTEDPLARNVYKRRLDEVASKNGLELKLILPEKKQFIMAEMDTIFVTSVILILIVLVMSWRTILSLLKEKQISEHTTDFLNNMTHEFKTPLTNIALAGKMIQRDQGYNHEEKLRHYSEIILKENDKLKQQVEQVLSMTALEKGDIPLQKAGLDMHSLIHDSLKCISVQIEHHKGIISLDLSASKPTVWGDRIHLGNALCNLLDNAIKYSGGQTDITLRTRNEHDKLLISVSDKGIGIKKEYHRKIFDTFFRVPTGNLHDVKGFGLGLAYVKKIAELHKGSVILQSEKGKGSTFTIILPNA